MTAFEDKAANYSNYFILKGKMPLYKLSYFLTLPTASIALTNLANTSLVA